MNIQIALIRQEDSFDAALLVDGKFRRALAGQDPTLLITRAIAPFLAGLPVGADILVNVVRTLPDEKQPGENDAPVGE